MTKAECAGMKMPSKSQNRAPADLGLLSETVAGDVAILQTFFAERERQMSRLFGRTLRRHPVRDEIIRLVILEYAAGRRRRPAFYVKECASLATPPSIRSELDLLDHLQLIVKIADPTRKGAMLVAPTMKLIDFYNTQMPRLRETVLELLPKTAVDIALRGRSCSA